MTETKTITGTIKAKNVTNGTNQKGQKWTRYEFVMDDDFKYSTFDEKLGNKFNEGDAISMDLEQKGKFWNIKDITATTDEKVSSEGSETPKTGFHLSPEQVRTNALEAAAMFYNANGEFVPRKIETMIDHAKIFEKWIKNG